MSEKPLFPTKFDYYSATVFDQSVEFVLDTILEKIPQASSAPTRPQKSYHKGFKIARSDQEFCVVSYGGVNDGVHVESKSNSPTVVPIVKGWNHQVSRVDSCIDVSDPFFFEWLNSELTRIALQSNIKLDQSGDWERGKARTRYLGTRQSLCQICAYEKGQKEQADPDWVRLEVRIRPQKKHHKLRVAKLDSDQVFVLPTYLKTLYKKIGMQYQDNHLKAIWKSSDVHNTRYHLIKQYGKTLSSFAEHCGGWEQMGGIVEQAVSSIEDKELPAKTIQLFDAKTLETT